MRQKDETVYESLSVSYRRFFRELRQSSSYLIQSFLALLLSGITAVLAGVVLGTSQETLLLLPGLIVLVPPALGMRGNIFASLGSRLGSAMHLGTVDRLDLKNPIIRSNISTSLVMTLIMSVYLGIVAKVVTSLFGIGSISIATFIAISFIGGVVAGVALLILTLLVSFVAFRRGWDPDNVTSPLITAFGDFLTIPSLLLATHLILPLQDSVVFISILFTVATALAAAMSYARIEYRTVLTQVAAVLALAGLIDTLAGVALESHLNQIISIPMILVLIPAFLAQGGNIGNILASRLGTKLHLGTIDARLTLGKEIKREFFSSYVLSFLIFSILGLLAFYASTFAGIETLSLPLTLTVTLVAGYILTTIVVIATFLIATLSFRYGFDPDNVTIPLITAVADILGVVALFVTLSMLGVTHFI